VLEAESSGIEIVRHGLIEYELWAGLALGRIEDRSLIQEKVSLGRSTSRRDGRRLVGELEVGKDREDDGRIGEESKDPHVATTRGAEQRQHVVDAGEQHSPTDAGGVCGASRFRIDGGLTARRRASGA